MTSAKEMQGGRAPAWKLRLRKIGEKEGQGPDLGTTLSMLRKRAAYHSRLARPSNSFAMGKLLQGWLNLLLRDVNSQGST